MALLTLALLTGALLGAVGMAVPMRRRVGQLRSEIDDAATRLGQAASARAAAEAESRLLLTQNHQLTDQASGDNSVLRALAPVAEKLGQVQSQVGLLERERAQQYGQLAELLQEARLADARLLSTTHSLASALRSNSARGQWGEIQLRRVVEAAGMLPRVDFLEQATINVVSTETGSTSARPDMVVHLPGNKQLVVDAKVPLSAYLEAHGQTGGHIDPQQPVPEDRRTALLVQHAKALRQHVDALARKKYWDGTENSPELVVCFIPAESVLSSALQADPSLLDYAFSRNVALASPVSLLAILKGTAFSWRQEVLTENARELFTLSRELYERLGTMGGHVAKLGNSLRSSVERYNSFVGTLESRVLPTARKINAFDAGSLDQSDQAAVPAVDATPRLLGAPELIDGEEVERSA